MKDLDKFKNRILFNEIHMTERSDVFSKLCHDVDFCIRYGFEFRDKVDDPYISFLKLAGGVLKREMLIKLCEDLKERTDWKSLHGVWNDGDENRYQDHFRSEIELAKKLMVKLRPLLVEYTKSWTAERKQMDLEKPEGRFMKGWYLNGEVKTTARSKTMKH